MDFKAQVQLWLCMHCCHMADLFVPDMFTDPHPGLLAGQLAPSTVSKGTQQMSETWELAAWQAIISLMEDEDEDVSEANRLSQLVPVLTTTVQCSQYQAIIDTYHSRDKARLVRSIYCIFCFLPCFYGIHCF